MVEVVEVLVASRFKEERMSCPICDKELFSEVGEGCLMCGMSVDKGEFFCCKLCMRKYNKINRNKNLNKAEK